MTNNKDNHSNQDTENKDKKVVTPETQDWYFNPSEKKVDIKREDRLIGAICYAPFGFIAPFITKKSSNFLSIHTKQWAIIFFFFLFLMIVLPFWLKWLLFIMYLWFAWYPAYQAFSGHAFQYKFLNKIISKITNIFSKNKKIKK